MSFTMEAPESVETGGSFLEQPGTYHFAVLDVDEQPQSKSGQLIDGFRVTAEVLAGTVDGQEGRQVDLIFFNPKLTDKNNGEFAKKRQWRFGMAVCLVGGPKKPGEQATVNLQDAKGRQFIATVAYDDRDTSGRKFLQLNFADIWHVDDPQAPRFRLNEAALAWLPKEMRRDPSFFKQMSSNGKTANGNQGGVRAAVQPSAPPPPPPSEIDVNDI